MLEKYIAPVSRLYDDLRESSDTMGQYYLRILEYYYLGDLTVSSMLEITRWSKSTFFSRRYSLVVLAVGYIFPEVD